MSCVCAEINSRHCPVHGQRDGDWFSVQAGFWRSLWLVVCGVRVRELKYLALDAVPDLMSEEDA